MMNATISATVADTAIFVFKTNIRLLRDVRRVAQVLDADARIVAWNVDRQDTDHVLRVLTGTLDEAGIISLIQLAGYTCVALPD